MDKILIVDDEELMRNLCVRTLKNKDFEIAIAADGDEALELVKKNLFDLVITDLTMPGKIDGKELLHEVKRISNSTDVIIMTANPAIDTTIAAVKEGAYYYIVKPFNRDELSVVVKHCFEKRKLSKDLEKAFKELKILNDSREMFMQLLVHDMKNPLSGIIGNAQIMLMDKMNQEQQETMTDILSSSQRLHEMVVNLLDIGRMEEGGLVPNYQPVKAGDILKDIVKTMGSRFQNKEIHFTTSLDQEEQVLLIDRQLMSRILQNLLDNSLHYTEEGGAIELSISNGNDNYVFIRIKDTGQAVSEDYRESIFTRYGRITRGGARTNRGLGLYFCKLAIEAQAGTIELEDSHSGCSFLMKLPVICEKPKAVLSCH